MSPASRASPFKRRLPRSSSPHEAWGCRRGGRHPNRLRKLPAYQLDRAGTALLDASLMVGLGVVLLDEAYRAIDFDTITLLLGMMILFANLRLRGSSGW